MTPRAHYFIQILEKIGAPLLASIINASEAEQSDQAQAQKMAELLSKSVQTSIAIGDLIDIGSMGEQSDSMRVALAGLASPIVAGQYQKSGTPPSDADIKTLSSALQAVLTFSETFTPGQENAARLAELNPRGQETDEHQVHVQMMQAFVPVINAIQEFPFGQQETRLMTEISTKLINQADDIAALFANGDDQTQKRVSLGVLAALAKIYAACHTAETTKIMSMSDDDRAAQPQAPGGGLSLENVWAQFDKKVSLLQTLAQTMLGDAAQSGQSAAAPKPPPATTQPPPPATTEGPATPPPSTPAPTQPPSQDGAQKPAIFGGGSSSPPPSTPPSATDAPAAPPPSGDAPQKPAIFGGGSASPPPTTPPPATSAPTQPPSQDGAQKPAIFGGGSASPPPTTEAPPPPATEAPTPPPTPTPTETPDQGDNGGGDQGGSNPMSFFKKGE